jgi:hypothetical protein
MLDMIEPTDTILTVIIAGIVFVLMWLLIVLKIGIGPLSMLTSVLSNILERLLDEGNKYIVNFINLVVLAAMIFRVLIDEFL